MFAVRLLGGPLLDEAGAAGQGPDVVMQCILDDAALEFDMGGRLGRRRVPAASLHGVKKGKNKVKLLLTPAAGGPGHIIGLRSGESLAGADDPAFRAFVQAVVRAVKGRADAAGDGKPAGQDVMKAFRPASAASAKGRRLAGSDAGAPAAAPGAARAVKAEDVADHAGGALAEQLGAAMDLAAAERGDAAVADGALPDETVRSLALEADDALRAEHRSLVKKGAIVTEEEFWLGFEERLQALRDAAARLRARAHSRRRSALRQQKRVGMRDEVEMTPEAVQQLLATDSRVRAAYAANVGGRVSMMEFWKRYFAHMARQRQQAAARRREDAIAGRAEGSESRGGAQRRGDEMFRGLDDVSGRAGRSTAADAAEARGVSARFNLGSTAEDAQTGVMAAGRRPGVDAAEGAGRGGRGTGESDRLYEPDDVTAASSAEAVRVRARAAKAEEIATECRRFASVALPPPSRAPKRGRGDDAAVDVAGVPRGLVVDEEAAERMDDLVAARSDAAAPMRLDTVGPGAAARGAAAGPADVVALLLAGAGVPLRGETHESGRLQGGRSARPDAPEERARGARRAARLCPGRRWHRFRSAMLARPAAAARPFPPALTRFPPPPARRSSRSAGRVRAPRHRRLGNGAQPHLYGRGGVRARHGVRRGRAESRHGAAGGHAAGVGQVGAGVGAEGHGGAGSLLEGAAEAGERRGVARRGRVEATARRPGEAPPGPSGGAGLGVGEPARHGGRGRGGAGH